MILLKLVLTVIHELGIADVTWKGDMFGTHSEESGRAGRREGCRLGPETDVSPGYQDGPGTFTEYGA